MEDTNKQVKNNNVSNQVAVKFKFGNTIAERIAYNSRYGKP